MTPSEEDYFINREFIYRTFVEQADEGIFVASPDGTYVHVNRSGHRLLGYSDNELVGMHIRDIVPAPDLDRMQTGLDLRGEASSYLSEWQLVRKDGSLLQAEVMSQRLGNGMLLAMVRNRAEARKEDQARLELTERLQKIASQLPGVVYQFKLRPDGSSCFPYASERIEEIYRVKPEEVADDASAVFAILHPDDYDGIVESIMQSALTLDPWKYEYRVRFPDGNVRWLFGNAIPEREPDGSVLWHGFITDISENKEAEETKALLEAQLLQAQKMESIGRLAGGIAHDFNNLLTSILGFSELALQELETSSRASAHIQRVMETAQRSAVLTQQLLAFARKKIVHPEAVNLSKVITQLAPMVQRLIGSDIELLLNTPKDVGAVMIDAGSLQQVLMNLVVNARDAMPKGGRLCIETAPYRLDEEYTRLHADLAPGEYVAIIVSDNGSGMQRDVQNRIFEPFFTTKPLGQGTGLGLATCFGIVKQARGHITVYSEQGRGTAFKVYLPKVGLPGAGLENAPAAVKQGKGMETVLLVEDDPSILGIAREALQNLGYKVLSETNGERALQLARQFAGPIDLLVTDVVMPRMGGKELAEELSPERPHMKVLFTSGYTEDAIVREGVLEEGIEFLQKPYTLSGLAARVRGLLDAE